jgi:diguanylate cyclase (GGDEF)-like protein
MQTLPPRRPSDIEDLALDDEHSPSTQSKIAAPVGQTGAEHPVLVLLTGLNAGQVFRIETDETIIGRSRSAHVRIDDAGVSRKNTRIVRSGNAFFVEDMGSRNGTFKNGHRVMRSELSSGDRIHVSPTIALRFAVMGEAEEVLARQLYEASTRDTLTRAYNRRYFNQRLIAEIAFAQRHKTNVSVILIDVDHFKRVNDTWGHKAGDEVLRELAVAIQGAIRAEDVFARYGGEEFAILVRGIDHRAAGAFAERLRVTVGKIDMPFAGETGKITISAGVASLSDNPKASIDDLLLLADERLYRAKEQGRNRVVG